MASPPARRDDGPGPLPAIVGGVVGALILFWVVTAVIGTIVFAVKVVAFVAVIAGAVWLWGKISRD